MYLLSARTYGFFRTSPCLHIYAIQITESTVEQLSGKEDESGADTKEEEPEQPVKSIVQVPGKIVVRPGVRRTSRGAADRRIDEDNEEENNDEQVEKTSKGQDMEEVTENIITLQFVFFLLLCPHYNYFSCFDFFPSGVLNRS